jgi:hypothetical protein
MYMLTFLYNVIVKALKKTLLTFCTLHRVPVVKTSYAAEVIDKYFSFDTFVCTAALVVIIIITIDLQYFPI